MLFKRRISLLLAVFLAVAVLFSGCGEEPTEKPSSSSELSEELTGYNLSPENLLEHGLGLTTKEFFRQFNADQDKAESDGECFKLAETHEISNMQYQPVLIFQSDLLSSFGYDSSPLPYLNETDYRSAYEHISLLYQDFIKKYGEPDLNHTDSSGYKDASFYELCSSFEDCQNWFDAGAPRATRDYFSVNEEIELSVAVMMQKDAFYIRLSYEAPAQKE